MQKQSRSLTCCEMTATILKGDHNYVPTIKR